MNFTYREKKKFNKYTEEAQTENESQTSHKGLSSK